jgi:hypothetical protein
MHPQKTRQRAIQASFAATVATLAALAAAPAAATELVTNGSFEEPNILSLNYLKTYDLGSTEITGWTVVGGQIHNTPDTFWGLLAAEGRHWVDLTGIAGYDKGLRSDAMAVTAGARYRISFAVGTYAAPNFGPATLGLSINGGAETLHVNTNVGAAGSMNWLAHSIDWVADGSTLALSFHGRENGAMGNLNVVGLDAVSVQLAPVPEPGTWALLVAGLALVGTAARRRA